MAMAADFGAHEVMELHEVMSCAIDGINHFQLYRTFVQDPQLSNILDHQIQFMVNEYNSLVLLAQQKGLNQSMPYRAPKNIQPTYGLRQPGAQSPNASPNQMDDRDIASGMLGHHKASSVGKIRAALECANPDFRRAMQQGAINCSEQAYEIWSFMNQKGHYQVPTMKQNTTQTMMGSFAQANEQAMQGNMNSNVQPMNPNNVQAQPMNPTLPQ